MKKLITLLNNDRGDITGLGVIFGIFVSLIFLFMAIDIVGYVSTHNKIADAGEEVLELMKAQNGFDSQLRNQFYELAERYGLEPGTIHVNGTPKLVQRGDMVIFEASTVYQCIAMKPFGQDITLPVNVELTGLARSFIRE